MELSHCLVGAFVELDCAYISVLLLRDTGIVFSVFLIFISTIFWFYYCPLLKFHSFSLIVQHSDFLPLLLIVLLACSCCRVWCPPGRAHSRSSGSARNPPGEVNRDKVDSWVQMLTCISQLFRHYCCVRIRTQLGVLFPVCSWRQSSWSSMWRLTGVPSQRSSDLLKLQIRWTFTETSGFLSRVTYHFRGFFLS